MNEDLKISVIICSYNREEYITGAIESLYNQTLPKQYYEVIVVDNNSIDNTKQVCLNYIQSQPGYNTYYLEEKQQGASFARNTGAAFAKAPLLAFMDDDAIADKDFLERIISFYEAYPDVSGLGGRIIPQYIPAKPKWMSHYVSSLVGNFHYSDKVEMFIPGKYPLESNMIVTKKDFNEVGGFNTLLPGVKGTIRIGGEGKDFFMKLQALGKKIYYDPSISVQHVVEVKKLTPEYMYRVASGIGRGERVRMLSKSKSAYIKKIVEYLFKLGASFILGIKYMLQGAPAKAGPVIQFRIDALKGLLNR
ncbi:MAG: glycosyltransferase family 2 protein [Segetibacter sp.]|jgi:glycosyltransferase involved in cell wall biosynthesis|nr:glycosyltransferase family 2 protein [Segetibacter sp.]